MFFRLVLVVVFLSSWAEAADQGPQTEQKPSQASDDFFDSNGVRLHYISIGAGETIVYLHGAGGVEDPQKQPALRELAKDFRIVALHQRGYGKSEKPKDAQAYGMKMVEDLPRLLEHLGLEQAHFFGTSMGGAVVAKMSMTYPKRVKSAVIVAPPATAPREEFEVEAKQVADGAAKGDITPLLKVMTPAGSPLPPPAIIKMISKRFFENVDPQVFVACAKGLPALCSEVEERKKCTVPVLAIVGSKDPASQGLQGLADDLANARFVEIKGRDHVSISTANEFVDEVTAFIKTPSGSIKR